MLNIRDYWSEEYQMIKPHPGLTLDCQHNILEQTGKYLIACSLGVIDGDAEIITKIIARYTAFWSEIGFLPRVITYGNPPVEAKGNVWFKTNGYWINTSTSTTQTMYLLMGLWMNGCIGFVGGVMQSYIDRGWAIRYDGKIVPNGSFFPFGIIALQRYILGRIVNRNPGLTAKLMLSFVGTWATFKKNYIVIGKTLDEGEWLGIAIWLYWIGILGEKQHFAKFAPKYKDVLIAWREKNLENTNDGDRLGDTLGLAITKKIFGE